MSRFPRSRSHVLALGLLACVLQLAGGFQPALVICYKPDRPPRVELFSGACACSQEELHSRLPHDGQRFSHLEKRCIDMHLDPDPALFASILRKFSAAGDSSHPQCLEFPAALATHALWVAGAGHLQSLSPPGSLCPPPVISLRC